MQSSHACSEVHLQMMALLKDYDLFWPRASATIMSLSDAANLGIAVTAPECYWRNYGFFNTWTFTMILPVSFTSR